MAMMSDTDSAVPGVGVDLVRVSTGELIGSAVTDEDGYYTIPYKHKGKRANYDVTLNGGHGITQRIQLKANGWGEVNFDVFTGTSTGEFNLDPNGGGGPGGPGGCTATEDPEVSCNDGVDNDCDGDTDLVDTDCGGGCTATEDPEVTCDDGVDNDCDGNTDAEDTDCSSGGGCTDAQVGDSCTENSDCCSNKCKGRSGKKVCK
jgi:hypothetical protein